MRKSKRIFDVKMNGGVGDGLTNDTKAIQLTIDRASKCGGFVFFPPGTYLSGTVILKSGITIRLDPNAVVVASRKTADFLEYERLDYESHADNETTYYQHALFYGFRVSDILIIGRGRIVGRGTKRGGPKVLAFKRAKNLRIQNIQIEDSPNYNISMLGCKHVEIVDVTIKNGFSDGIVLDCSENISIKGCHIESRNDAICLKSSLALANRRSTKGIVVEKCCLATTRSALKLGSESFGSFRNITFRNCRIRDAACIFGEPAEGGIAIQLLDRGQVENIRVTDIVMENVTIPIFLRYGKRKVAPNIRSVSKFDNVWFVRLVAANAKAIALISGLRNRLIQNIKLNHIVASLAGGGDISDSLCVVPEQPIIWSRCSAFGPMPASCFFIRHARKVVLTNVTATLERPDVRPAVLIKNATLVRPHNEVSIENPKYIHSAGYLHLNSKSDPARRAKPWRDKADTPLQNAINRKPFYAKNGRPAIL